MQIIESLTTDDFEKCIVRLCTPLKLLHVKVVIRLNTYIFTYFIYFSSSQYCNRCLMLLSSFQSCFYHKTAHILSALHTHVPGSCFTRKSNMISVEPPVTKFTQNSGVDSIIIILFFFKYSAPYTLKPYLIITLGVNKYNKCLFPSHSITITQLKAIKICPSKFTKYNSI